MLPRLGPVSRSAIRGMAAEVFGAADPSASGSGA
jgi:hypothetical protein